jgi:hypothetical protein
VFVEANMADSRDEDFSNQIDFIKIFLKISGLSKENFSPSWCQCHKMLLLAADQNKLERLSLAIFQVRLV